VSGGPRSCGGVVQGKFLNCGQVCIAPVSDGWTRACGRLFVLITSTSFGLFQDYVLVEASAEGKLIAALKDTLTQFFGPDPKVLGVSAPVLLLLSCHSVPVLRVRRATVLAAS
jgi:hypothetical protein